VARLITIPYKPRELQKRLHAGIEAHRFSVIVAHRRFGKTLAVVNHLIKQACLCPKVSPRFGYIAPFREQAKLIAWDYLKRFTSVIPGTKANESDLTVTLPNKAVIRIFGADNPDALRGMYFDGVVLDEVAQMKPDVWDEIITPSLADRKGFAVFIGTPKGLNKFYEIYQAALKDPDWYAELFDVTNTDALDQEEIDLQRSIMPPNKFRQEYMCDFSASVEDALISIDLVSAAYGKVIQQGMHSTMPIVIGVDVARFGDDKSIIYVRQGLATLQVRKFHGIDLYQFSENVMHSINEHKPDGVFIDVVGLGAGVVDMLKHKNYDVSGINVGSKPSNEAQFVNKRAEIWWRMREWFELGGAIPEDPELRLELVTPLYSYDAANRIKLEKKEDMKARREASPDIADALALTFSQPVTKRRPEFLNKPKVWDPWAMLQDQRSI
jgi:hypothetical protein